jgi:hypothetical protein
MKVLTILLCVLLVLAPAKAQQIQRPPAPSFYVPYGVRDLRPAPVEEWSSSAAELPAAGDVVESRPMRRRIPVGRGGCRRCGPWFGGYPMPQTSLGEGAIWGLVILGLVALPLLAGDR